MVRVREKTVEERQKAVEQREKSVEQREKTMGKRQNVSLLESLLPDDQVDSTGLSK